MFPSTTGGWAVAHHVHPPTDPAHHTQHRLPGLPFLLREKSVLLVGEAVDPEEGRTSWLHYPAWDTAAPQEGVLWFGALVSSPGKRGVTHNGGQGAGWADLGGSSSSFPGQGLSAAAGQTAVWIKCLAEETPCIFSTS